MGAHKSLLAELHATEDDALKLMEKLSSELHILTSHCWGLGEGDDAEYAPDTTIVEQMDDLMRDIKYYWEDVTQARGEWQHDSLRKKMG